jgi:hypothetical protein
MQFNKVMVTSNATNILNADMKIQVLWDVIPCRLIVTGNLERHSVYIFTVKLLKMESLYCSATTVTIYQLAWHNVPENLDLHQNQCQKFKFGTILLSLFQISPQKFGIASPIP